MNRIFVGNALDVLKTLDSKSAQTCVTSPPYFGLRDYGMKGQIGLEDTPEAYVQKMVDIFREVRRVIRDDGTLWLNLGDSYAGSGKGAYGDGMVRLSEKSSKQQTSAGTHQGVFQKQKTGLKTKDLIGIPWRVAFALQADGWYLRQDIIWHKPNPMPESVTDRCTKAHEYVFLLTKSRTYRFDADAIKEKAIQNRWGGKKPMNPNNSKGDFRGLMRDRDMMPELRNRRSVWIVPTKPYRGAHFATFPPALVEPCILAGAPVGTLVLDPFVGSGTTAAVARTLHRHYIGIELNPVYVKLAHTRLRDVALSPTLVAAE